MSEVSCVETKLHEGKVRSKRKTEATLSGAA